MKNNVLSKREILKSTFFVIGFWTMTAFLFYGIFKIVEAVPKMLTCIIH